MTDNLNNLETAVGSLLARELAPSPERIREMISQFRQIPTCSVDDDAAEQLARQFEVRHGVTMTIGSMLTDREHEPWLDGARADIDPYYWERYRRLLGEKGFSSQVLATFDSVTDRILGLMENPGKDGPWDRRGMVVGHVQSGKTANYTGLICKAADAGYGLVVVIAGIHNNLRNQTQARIDEGFVGRDSSRLLTRAGNTERFIGVGRFDQTRRPVTFTNALRDFNKNTATSLGLSLQTLSEPAVFVIKKNPNTLKNLIEWLQEHNAGQGRQKIDAPMLLIDDEADNASINISYTKDEVSRINGQIRQLLGLFERSCYIGYTATPFANIFIDPDTDDEMLGEDLFPRHFIVSLDPPDNYFGANRVFIDDADRVIRYIDDNEDLLPLKHPKDTEVVALPPSLISAIRVFVVARAIRLSRGHESQHCSMLVNASRFTDVQRRLRNEIHTVLDDIKASTRINGALPTEQALRDPQISDLYSIWQSEYSETGFDWPVVQQYLHDAAAPIRVVEVNSRSAGTLNYAEHKAGLNIIAVGGFSLSRGLTLEGLMISYFLRNSMMYDTLMQMGRWFGYRPDYEDLCRVWMPEEAEGWYAHIAESIEELRDELRSMESAGATPEEFGLKVRSHPDTLIVTARNKMGSSKNEVVRIGLGNKFIETAILKRDRISLDANRLAAQRLTSDLSELGKPTTSTEEVTGGWLLRGSPVKPVLGFITGFRNHTGSILTDPGPVRRYIEDRQEDELAEWDILFASIRGSNPETVIDWSLGIRINCQLRTAGRKSNENTLYVTNKQRVASRGIEKTGLTAEEIAEAERNYREGRKTDNARAPNYPDLIYRAQRQRPLLIIHMLHIIPEDGGRSHLEPVVAYSISFPRTDRPERRVEYVVNTTWLRENFRDDLDEDEMEGNDD